MLWAGGTGVEHGGDFAGGGDEGLDLGDVLGAAHDRLDVGEDVGGTVGDGLEDPVANLVGCQSQVVEAAEAPAEGDAAGVAG